MPYTKRIVHHGNCGNLLGYILDEEKTDGGEYVSSLNCGANTAVIEFENNRKKWKDKNKRCAYHIVQSFAPADNISPQEANEIGMRLCKELYPDFQCVVATHIDRGHLHNHIAICAMNLHGKKLEDKLSNQKEGMYAYKEASDRIAKEYGCFVLPHSKIKLTKNKKDNYRIWKEENWNQIIKQDIDEQLKESGYFQELIDNLIAIGYEVKGTGKYISVKAPGMERYRRLDTLGKGYSENDLHSHFQNRGGYVNLPDITVKENSFNSNHLLKTEESRIAIQTTSKVPKTYTEFQKTRYKEICRFYKLKREIDILSDNEIFSFSDLSNRINHLRAEIHNNNVKIKQISNSEKSILDKAEKAHDFIRLFRIHQYSNYYKEFDEKYIPWQHKKYEAPPDDEIFLSLKNELKIETVEEAAKLIQDAKETRIVINEIRNENQKLKNKLNELDIIKEKSLVDSNLYLHHIKFGNNQIDYKKSTETHWYVNIPYTKLSMFVSKELTTFNNKYGYNTAFLVDDEVYTLYNEEGKTLKSNGASIDTFFVELKRDNDMKYKKK